MSGVLVLGSPDEVRGFALAGVEGRTPLDARGLETELQLAVRAGAGLVLVTEAVAKLSPRAIEAAIAHPAPPIVVVLP